MKAKHDNNDLNDVLQVTRDARGVVTLTLNDPARFNALGGEMLTALQQALDDVARDDTRAWWCWLALARPLCGA